MKDAVDASNGVLDAQAYEKFCTEYRKIIEAGEIECPRVRPPPKRFHQSQQKRCGKIKQSKSRNLLERLRDFENEVLRFASDPDVPFTNNQGEKDSRMTKVQQKISGCFSSMDGAHIFCRVRSYISTCIKHEVSAIDGLRCLFEGNLPEFMQ